MPPILDVRSGWGLVALQPISHGQAVVRVPREATMSAASALQCPLAGPVVAAGNLSDWQVCRRPHLLLALSLCHEGPAAG